MPPWPSSAALDGAQVGILGFGLEGQAALRWLRARAPGARAVVFDQRPVALPEGVEGCFGPFAVDRVAACDALIRSPGVRLAEPALAAARSAGVPVTTGSSRFLAERGARTVVAVTGTKGKSTISALAAHLLAAAGVPVQLGGNIGVPLLDLDPAGEGVVVAELSSYQVADLTGHPTVALLANLFPEHLDWHGGEEAYYGDKARLVALAERIGLVNARSAAAVAWTHGMARRHVYNTADGWVVDDDGIRRGGRRLAPAPGWRLRGRHNRDNLEAALAVVAALGVAPEAVLPAIESFAGLPHRQQVVAERSGRRYVDDSLATTPHATLAALDAFADAPAAVIVGGFDRGLDWRAFAERLAERPVRSVIVRGANGERILTALARWAPDQRVVPVDALAEAVAAAEASLGPDGGTVLLSPGAPSFGEFRNYAERGEAFRRLCAP